MGGNPSRPRTAPAAGAPCPGYITKVSPPAALPEVTQCSDLPHPAQARIGSQAASAFQQACTILVAGNTVFIVIGAGAFALTMVPSGAVIVMGRNAPSFFGRCGARNATTAR